jgi:UDP-3-O-[3-hydroxymyristoyl] N-acetylglucosamine deacetylase
MSVNAVLNVRRTARNNAGTLAYAGPSRQSTLLTEISCTGIGLHSGRAVTMTLRPAAPDTGINFCRTDLPGQPIIPARFDRATDLVMCTSLGADGAKVGTVEHLLAALSGLGIDNAMIDIDGPEVPVMDGSSAPFVFLLECAGVATQAAPRRYMRILETVEVRDGDKFARLEPFDGFSVSVQIDFESRAIGRQSVSVSMGSAAFKSELARARTFGFEHEVEYMRSQGLARGGSLDNAVVVSGDRILNEGGLRFDDEFVRHKALDAVGDLFLAGAPILGRFVAAKTGHALNNKLLRELFARPSAWSLETVSAPEAALAAAE